MSLNRTDRSIAGFGGLLPDRQSEMEMKIHHTNSWITQCHEFNHAMELFMSFSSCQTPIHEICFILFYFVLLCFGLLCFGLFIPSFPFSNPTHKSLNLR
jgi:hypothetical protein